MAIEGWLDYVSEHGVAGWAFDTESPGAHLTVIIRREGRLIGEARCNIFRPDLLEANVGRGDHAFVYSFATAIAPRDVSHISASIAGELLPVFEPKSPNDGPLPQIQRTLAADFRPQETEPAESAACPVFVLGSVRSGTSAMATALTSTTRYVGFREGQVFDLILQLRHCLQAFYANKEANLQNDTVMLHHVPQDFVMDHLHAAFQRLALQVFSSNYWVDKTPNVDMIRLAPTLRRIWPRARFIFMKRRGIDNLMSRLRKFPDSIAFRTHCSDWSSAMEAWVAVRPELGTNGLEIDQREMLLEPDYVGRRVGNFLELEEFEARSLGAMLRDDSLERTNGRRDEIAAISEAGWSSEQITIFRDICGAAMRKFGYGFGKSYFENAASHQ